MDIKGYSGRRCASEHVIANMMTSSYSTTRHPIDGRVTAMASCGNHVFVSVANRGCQIFRIDDVGVTHVATFAKDTTLSELHVTPDWLVYIKDVDTGSVVCVHGLRRLIDGDERPVTSLPIVRHAPLVTEPDLDLVVIAGAAWTSSWTSEDEGKTSATSMPADERRARALRLPSLELLADWCVARTAVGLLRAQQTSAHSMLGVSDRRVGLTLYDLRQPLEGAAGGFAPLHVVPVEEVRDFALAGSVVAVFHRFEANISFWDVEQQMTILCVNIQDQMKEFDENRCVDAVDDADDADDVIGADDDGDHVTCVTSLPAGGASAGHVLLCGTLSGAVYGISVDARRRLFTVAGPRPGVGTPPHTGAETNPDRPRVRGLRFVPSGRLVVLYDTAELGVFDYGGGGGAAK